MLCRGQLGEVVVGVWGVVSDRASDFLAMAPFCDAMGAPVSSSIAIGDIIAARLGFEPSHMLHDWAREAVALIGLLAALSAVAMLAIARNHRRLPPADAGAVPPPIGSAAVGGAPLGCAPVVQDLADIYRQYRSADSERRLAAAAAPAATRGGDTVVLAAEAAAIASARSSAWLELADGSGRRFAVSAAICRIGRHTDNDIVLPNVTVHRHHAVLQESQGHVYELRDLGGANGTQVNGLRCSHVALSAGDMIQLGDLKLRFLISNGT